MSRRQAWLKVALALVIGWTVSFMLVVVLAALQDLLGLWPASQVQPGEWNRGVALVVTIVAAWRLGVSVQALWWWPLREPPPEPPSDDDHDPAAGGPPED